MQDLIEQCRQTITILKERRVQLYKQALQARGEAYFHLQQRITLIGNEIMEQEHTLRHMLRSCAGNIRF